MPACPPTTRRTALVVAGGVAGLAVGACTSESGGGPDDPVSTSVPPVDADQVLVDDVVGRLVQALSAVVGATARSPRLKTELAPLRRMHLAHLSALGTDAPSFLDRDGAADLAQVLAAEARVQRYLADAAVRAESGALAKLLASMSASVAQHLAAFG